MAGSTLMRRPALWAILILSATLPAGLSAPARADVLPFTGPWQVTLGAITGTAGRAFGMDATANGQVLNLNALTGQGKAAARTESTIILPGGPDTAGTRVNFARPFTLPPGFMYTLNIGASLAGDLIVRDPLGLLNPATDSADVTANALMEVQGGAIVLDIVPGGFGLGFSAVGGASTVTHIDTGVIRNSTAIASIPPGDYDIFGTLRVDASSTKTFPLTNLEADFFSFGSFAVFGSVDKFEILPPPVPHPSSAELLLLGGCVLLGYARLRSRAGSLPSCKTALPPM